MEPTASYFHNSGLTLFHFAQTPYQYLVVSIIEVSYSDCLGIGIMLWKGSLSRGSTKIWPCDTAIIELDGKGNENVKHRFVEFD